MNKMAAKFGALCVLTTLLSSSGAEAGFKSLYSFKGGSDGSDPNGNLVRDSSGNLFGTTYTGGGTGCGGSGCGTVFKLTPKGQETVLHAFGGGNDGYNPFPGLFEDRSGNLYGTTYFGGGTGCGGTGCGTMFKISLNGVETILHAFAGGSDGTYPNGPLIGDSEGNLYGTTQGGNETMCASGGCGTVFELNQAGTLTTLHSFTSGNDGAIPDAGLIADSKGNFYGTTYFGGPYASGTIFGLTAKGTQSVLYAFDIGFGGEYGDPYNSVTLDGAGDLFVPVQRAAYGCDAVFELPAKGSAGLVYTFTGGNDGCSIDGNLTLDSSGNLYGVASGGGANGDGTVYKLSSKGTETTLHAFAGTDGAGPNGGMVANKRTLYGATASGGSANEGTIFQITE